MPALLAAAPDEASRAMHASLPAKRMLSKLRRTAAKLTRPTRSPACMVATCATGCTTTQQADMQIHKPCCAGAGRAGPLPHLRTRRRSGRGPRRRGRSMWSDPMPAVRMSFRFLAFSMRSRVMYAGWNGVVITIVASSRCLSSSGALTVREAHLGNSRSMVAA